MPPGPSPGSIRLTRPASGSAPPAADYILSSGINSASETDLGTRLSALCPSRGSGADLGHWPGRKSLTRPSPPWYIPPPFPPFPMADRSLWRRIFFSPARGIKPCPLRGLSPFPRGRRRLTISGTLRNNPPPRPIRRGVKNIFFRLGRDYNGWNLPFD